MSEEAIIPEDDDIQDELEGEQLEDELESTESEDAEADDEVEIIVDEEDTPSSKPEVPVSALVKARKRARAYKAENTEEVQALKRKIEMQEEELKLFQLKQQEKPKSRPSPEDFDTDEAYHAELDEYYKERARAEARDEVKTALQSQQTQTTQAQNDQKLEEKITKHYERVANLKVSNYDESEQRAVDILGDDVANVIMSSNKNSAELLYFLGRPANEAKAQYFKNLLLSDPAAGLQEMAVFAATKLKARPKRSTAPDPETKVEGGVSAVKKGDNWPKGAKMW